MELKFAMLADWVGETREGKLVISGEFDMILAKEAPITHLQMYLVARFHANVAEGSQHNVSLCVVGPKRQEIARTVNLDFPFQPRGPGKPLRGQVIVQLPPLNLPEFGNYHIELRVDEKLRETIPFVFKRIGG